MKRGLFLVLGLFFAVALLFFNPIFKGNIPFPGDLLIGEYTPYNSYPFKGYAPGAYPNKGQNFDVIRIIYPAKFFSIQTLKAGQIPLWNPHIFSGNPHLASLQSGTFYPMNVLFFILPFSLAWTVYIIVQPILAAFFTYLFLKRIKLSRFASILGSIAFAFSSFSVVWMEYGNLNHSYLWLPLLLFLIVSILKNPSVFKYILFIFALTSSTLAGYIQFSIYVYFFSFAFLLFYIFTNENEGKIRKIGFFVVLYIVSVLLSSIQLFPTIELFLQSTRSAYSTSDFLKLLIPSFHFLTFIIPDFFGNPASRNYWLNGTYIERVTYIGIIPAFFAFYSLISKANKMVWFFAASSFVLLLIVFDTFISRALYSLYVPPILSTGVPSRIIFLFTFSASVLAAFGLSNFQNKFILKKIFIVSTFFTFIFAFIWAITFFGFNNFFPNAPVEAAQIAKRNLIVPSGMLFTFLFGLVGYYIFTKQRRMVVAFFIFVTIVELFYFFKKITPFAPLDTIYPTTSVMNQIRRIQGIDRVWGYGSGYISTNLQVMEGIYGSDGYDALHLKRYGEFLLLSNSSMKSPHRSEAELKSGFGIEDLKGDFSRKRVIDLLGIKYILNKTTNSNSPDTLTFPENDYKLVWNDEKWQIYENKQSVKRAYFASRVIVEKDNDKILKLLLDKNFNPKNTAIIEENISLNSESASGTAKVISYTPNKIEISTQTTGNSLLVLTDNYYSGWKAMIDGVEAKIYRTNYAFRGVMVPEGKHTVKFLYESKSFNLGVIVSALTLGSVILYFIYLSRKK